MSWSVRHQGSPDYTIGLSPDQIVEAVRDGLYERNAEVLGPGEHEWLPFENHPAFEEIAEQIVDCHFAPAEDPEEQRIDLNPLIDVCLVLLVFFILATTMQVMEKVLDVPKNRLKSPAPQAQLERMIAVNLYSRNGVATYEVDNRVVAKADLNRVVEDLKRLQRKEEMLIDAKGVEWGAVVKAIDAAGHARLRKVSFLAKREPPAGE